MRRCAVAVTLAVLLPAGCGGTGGDTPPAAAPADAGYNVTDVMFLQMMTPHHRQGLAIVRLAERRPVRDEVRMLIGAIASTQRGEIGTMSGWLDAWGQPATAPSGTHAEHGGMPVTSAGEIRAVARTSDAGFEPAFLNLLIAHQDDAIQIARLELSAGRHRAAQDLARRIERSRTAQIKQMLIWLDQA